MVETQAVAAPSSAPSSRWANLGGTRAWGAVALAAAILLTVIPDNATVLNAPSPYESDAIADAPVLHDVSFGNEAPVVEAERKPVLTGKAKTEKGAVASIERTANGRTDVAKESAPTNHVSEAPPRPVRTPRAAKRTPAPPTRSGAPPPPPAPMAKSTPAGEPESMPSPYAAARSVPMAEAVPTRAAAHAAEAVEADEVYAEDMAGERTDAVDDASEPALRAATCRREVCAPPGAKGMVLTAEAEREKERRLREAIRSTDPLPAGRDFLDLAEMLRQRGDISEALSVVKRGLAPASRAKGRFGCSTPKPSSSTISGVKRMRNKWKKRYASSSGSR